MVGQFLSFLAKDIQRAPQNVMPLSGELYQQVQSLVSGVELHIDKPLLDEDE